jgi:hypothetical protein
MNHWQSKFGNDRWLRIRLMATAGAVGQKEIWLSKMNGWFICKRAHCIQFE